MVPSGGLSVGPSAGQSGERPVLCPVSVDGFGEYPGYVRRMSAGRDKSDTTPDCPPDIGRGHIL
jgi:hypothetical protein